MSFGYHGEWSFRNIRRSLWGQAVTIPSLRQSEHSTYLFARKARVYSRFNLALFPTEMLARQDEGFLFTSFLSLILMVHRLGTAGQANFSSI